MKYHNILLVNVKILGCRDPRYKHENPSITMMKLNEQNDRRLGKVLCTKVGKVIKWCDGKSRKIIDKISLDELDELNEFK